VHSHSGGWDSYHPDNCESFSAASAFRWLQDSTHLAKTGWDWCTHSRPGAGTPTTLIDQLPEFSARTPTSGAQDSYHSRQTNWGFGARLRIQVLTGLAST
jgi:hypothetical protein